VAFLPVLRTRGPASTDADGCQEYVMDRSFSCIENLDLEISVAYITLGGAREVWARSPLVVNQQRVDAAEAEVNRLLDRRLVVQQ
jgi:hypothetical protein